ncbi:hypothetical protein GCM10027035_02020 [Emticicia sediminis]
MNQKLFFELKEASARSHIHLKIFKSDVDIDGFDIIIDNNDDLLMKCQVKSRFNSTTTNFDIHQIMLKPNFYIFEKFEFLEPIGCPLDKRGVILIDADIENDKIICRYYYLDIFLLRALELGIFKLTNQSKTMAEKLLKVLRNGKSKPKRNEVSKIKKKDKDNTVKVLKTLFFPVNDVQGLLELMGFHSIHNSNLSGQILKVSEGINLPNKTSEEKINEIKPYWNNINEELDNLIYKKCKWTKCELKNDYFN